MKPDKCGSRRRKHAFCTTAFVAAAAMLTLAANAGSLILNDSLNWRADISKEQYTTLTVESKDILSRLNKDIYLYYTGGDELDDLRVTTLLKNYAAASKRVTYNLVDPSAHPGFIQLFDPDRMGIEQGCVIVSDSDSMKGVAPTRYKVLSRDDLYSVSEPYYNDAGALVSDYRYFSAEAKITTAIDYIMTDKSMTVIFLDGQGEKPPCESLLSDIRGQYYMVRTSDLTDTPLDPASDTLVEISPQTDLNEQTFNAVDSFLEQGGKAVFFMDMLHAGLGAQAQSRFETLLLKFGLVAQHNVVVGEDPSYTYMSRMNLTPELSVDSPVTAPIQQEAQTPVLSYAGAIGISAVPGVEASVLLKTDESSYAKQSWTDLAKCNKQQGDETGPFAIGVLAQKGDAAVGLFGSSSFVTSDNSYGISGNRQLFLNTIGYINGRQENGLIPMRTIYSASDHAYTLDISSEIEKGFYVGLTVVTVPLVVLFIGVSKWLRRRHQ